MTQFTQDSMRARLQTLNKAREKILAKSTPVRAARDAFVAEMTAREAEMNTAVREAEAGLFDIDMERGLLTRALGGKTGAPIDAG
jgi:hypothetical protein